MTRVIHKSHDTRLARATADGDSLPLRDAAELVGRLEREPDDSIAVMVTTVRRAGAESLSGVKPGTVVAVRLDSTVRVEVISGNPQAVERTVTAVTVGLVLVLLYLAVSFVGTT